MSKKIGGKSLKMRRSLEVLVSKNCFGEQLKDGKLAEINIFFCYVNGKNHVWMQIFNGYISSINFNVQNSYKKLHQSSQVRTPDSSTVKNNTQPFAL